MGGKRKKKHDTDKWESKALGASAEHAAVAPNEEQAIDDALGLQLVSIRLQKQLVEQLKLIAKEEGIGYQPLVRQILTRYVREQTLVTR